MIRSNFSTRLWLQIIESKYKSQYTLINIYINSSFLQFSQIIEKLKNANEQLTKKTLDLSKVVDQTVKKL